MTAVIWKYKCKHICDTWSKAYGASTLMACPNQLLLVYWRKKASLAIGPKEPILLISHGWVLVKTCSKPAHLFQSPLCLCHGGFAIYMAECASGKTERFLQRGNTFARICKVKAWLQQDRFLSSCTLMIFRIFYICHVSASLCVK